MFSLWGAWLPQKELCLNGISFAAPDSQLPGCEETKDKDTLKNKRVSLWQKESNFAYGWKRKAYTCWYRPRSCDVY